MSILTANILVIGVTEKSSALMELPIRLLVVDTETEAVQCMKKEKIQAVVSRWNLAGNAPGDFLERVIAAWPGVPTIAFIRPGDSTQEIAARSMGVSAVLNDDVDDDYFRGTICQLLNIDSIVAMRVMDHDDENNSDFWIATA